MNKTTLLCAALLGTIVPTKAATVYWDTNSILPGAADVGFDPNGFWDFSSANWNTDPTGGGAGVLNGWIDSADTAIFSAGTATGTYTVDISGSQTAAAIEIEDGTVVFANGTAGVGTGTITIKTGATLRIDSSLRLSGATGAKITLDGGTVLQTNPGNAGSFIPAAFNLEIGSGGGTVNFTSSGGASVALYQGTIVGSGTLTKRGPQEFRYQGLGLPNSTYGKLVVEEGLFRLGFNSSISDERGFGAVPLTFTPDAITLSGGGAIGTSFSTTLNANRGITLGAGGGVINGSSAVLTIPGAISGSGGLTIQHSVVLNGTNTYTGGTTLDGGVIQTLGTSGVVTVNSASGLGATTNSLTVNNRRTAAGFAMTLNLFNAGPTETGSLSGVIEAPASGVNTLTINNRGQLFTVNQTIPGVFPGVITGSGGFALGDLSAATLTLTGNNSYTGGTTVEGAILALAGSDADLGTGNVTVEGTGVKLTIQSGVLNAIGDTSILTLAGGGLPTFADFGYLELQAGINETVGGLVLGGVTQPNGTYGSTASTAEIKNDEFFSGTGVVTVVPEPGTVTGLLGAVSMLLGFQRFRRRS